MVNVNKSHEATRYPPYIRFVNALLYAPKYWNTTKLTLIQPRTITKYTLPLPASLKSTNSYYKQQMLEILLDQKHALKAKLRPLILIFNLFIFSYGCDYKCFSYLMDIQIDLMVHESAICSEHKIAEDLQGA